MLVAVRDRVASLLLASAPVQELEALRVAIVDFERTPADEALRIDIDWLVKARAAPLAGHPLVYLNACSTAEGDREFQSPFLTQFMREYDARGLIGSDWEIPTVLADAFSRRFFRRFLTADTTLGQAFTATSDEFMAAGNPFPLIYAIYDRTPGRGLRLVYWGCGEQSRAS